PVFSVFSAVLASFSGAPPSAGCGARPAGSCLAAAPDRSLPATERLAGASFAAVVVATSLAMGPRDLPVPALRLSTIAATPSHTVILFANRAGTIIRLRARGNGARHPGEPAARACLLCAHRPSR